LEEKDRQKRAEFLGLRSESLTKDSKLTHLLGRKDGLRRQATQMLDDMESNTKVRF